MKKYPFSIVGIDQVRIIIDVNEDSGGDTTALAMFAGQCHVHSMTEKTARTARRFSIILKNEDDVAQFCQLLNEYNNSNSN